MTTNIYDLIKVLVFGAALWMSTVFICSTITVVVSKKGESTGSVAVLLWTLFYWLSL